MNTERWKDTLGIIKDKFQIEDEGNEHIEDEGGIDIEYVVFNGGPLGRIRLEHITKPIILDKKTIYSKRIGSDSKVDYVYSENEKSQIMMAYKWNDTEEKWEEIDGNMFA